MAAADVVIVGASPAGLRAAWSAAHAGASVTLLETREQVGVPESPAALAFDFLWRASFRPPPFAVRRRLDGVRLASPAGHEVTVDAPLLLLRRARLDPWLANVAISAGARIVTGVRELRVRDDRTLVADGMDVKPRVLLFCDGAHTLARRFFEPVEHPERVTWGVALDVAAPGSEAAQQVRIAVGSHVPGGRAQLNPLDDGRWSHWTFYRGAREDAELVARAALGRDAARMGWPAEVALRARLDGVAPDAVYTIPRQLAADGVMVAGGAGGQGGLEVGLFSGEMAGRHAARAALAGRVDRASLAAYEREWMRAYLGGYRSMQRAVERLARLSDAQLDRIFDAWSGRVLPARDLVGLAHPSLARRVQAVARAVRANPGGAAVAVAQALRR